VWYTEDEHVERVKNGEEYDVTGAMFAERKRGKNDSPTEMQGRVFVYFKNKNIAQKNKEP
jgi:hypothetical protein